MGSNFVRHVLEKYNDWQVIVLDAMTYAARPEWVHDYFRMYPLARDRFDYVVCDLFNAERTEFIIKSYQPDHVIHFAAESHVCRSIETPRKFLDSNVTGTYNLLEACHKLWGATGNHRFHHVSTDEVYGELKMDEKELFHEERRYAPRSPYAASKAASDHIVKAFHHTFGMDATITNCSNNFGPNQDLEKLVPKTILSFIRGQEVELYGDGKQVRDWLWVNDHCEAIDTVFHHGTPGETYCVGGETELTNQQIVKQIHQVYSEYRRVPLNVTYTNKRPTDDRRYAVDVSKIKSIGWKPSKDLKKNLRATILWYLSRYGEEPKRQQTDFLSEEP